MPKDPTSYASADWDLEYVPDAEKRHESFAKLMDPHTDLEPDDHRELSDFATSVHNAITEEYFAKVHDGTKDDAIGKGLADLKVQFAQLAVNHHNETRDTGQVTAWTHAMTGLTSLRPNLLNQADFHTLDSLLTAAPEERLTPEYQDRLPLAYDAIHHGTIGAQESWQNALTEQSISSDTILAAFQDLSITPNTQPNAVQIVGTGGQGIWERDWSNRVDPDQNTNYNYLQYASGHQVPGDMRAMCFAKDLASAQVDELNDIRRQVNRQTPEGIARSQDIRDRVQEAIRRRSGDSLEHEPKPTQSRADPNDPAVDFARRHPDDADHIHSVLTEHARHSLEAGTDLVMQGLLENDLTKLNAGRSISDLALTSYRDAIADPAVEHTITEFIDSTEHRIFVNDSSPNYLVIAQAAQHQTAALQYATGTDDPDVQAALAHHAAVQHIARNCSAMDHSTQDMVDTIFPEPQSLLGEIHLRQLNQLTRFVFRDQRADFVSECTEHLANGDIQAAADALQHTHQYQLNLIATFFNQADNQGNPDHTPSNLAQEYTNETLQQIRALDSDEALLHRLDNITAAYPVKPPDHATGPESACREMLFTLAEANIEACQHLVHQHGAVAAIENPEFINYVAEATTISALARSGEIEGALARAATNPSWPS